jgi:hypothetical protein
MTSIQKVGFLMIIFFLMFMFFNQMPGFLADYSNYIILSFLAFFGGVMLLSIRRG